MHQEGHEVDFYLEDKDGPNLYKGILPRVKNWKDGIDKSTILVFDMSKMGAEADEMRKAGYAVVGGSALSDTMELDRAFGISVAENHGIAVPESEEFTDFEAAKEWIDGEDCGWVFKPNDNKEGVRTFVASDTEQMTAMLEHYSDLWKGEISFVLQKVIQGVEISSEVWCRNGEIIEGSYNNTLEQKRFMPGDKGPNTGCMGSTVRFNLCPGLLEATFSKLRPWLKQQKFTGPLDINTIVEFGSGTPYFLEWTPRFGYSAIYAMLMGLNMEVGEFLHGMATGEVRQLTTTNEWLASLRLTMPNYPHCEETPESEGLPILGLDLDDEKIWPLDIMLDKGKIVCSGYDSIICEVSGADESLEELWGDLYGRASEIKIPECQYRTDNLLDVQTRLEQLAEVYDLEDEVMA
jgi:phosphoribosylamine--glycine ligase